MFVLRARRALSLLAVLFFVAGCATRIAPAPPPPDPRTLMPSLEARIFEIVQNERHKIDPQAKMLALDSELVGVARAHSEDMAEKNYFAHKGPDGRTSADLIMDADAQFQGILGENLAAQHFIVGMNIDVDDLAHRFVSSWLASQSHKDNLAFPAYDRSGVGAAVQGNTIYVTQLFAIEIDQVHVPAKPRQVTVYPDPKSAKAAPASPGPDTSTSAQ